MMYRPMHEPFPAGKSVTIRPSSFFSPTLCWSSLYHRLFSEVTQTSIPAQQLYGHHVIRILHINKVPILLQLLGE